MNKTTEQLLAELRDKPAYYLAWSVMWRWMVIVLLAYAMVGLIVVASSL